MNKYKLKIEKSDNTYDVYVLLYDEVVFVSKGHLSTISASRKGSEYIAEQNNSIKEATPLPTMVIEETVSVQNSTPTPSATPFQRRKCCGRG